MQVDALQWVAVYNDNTYIYEYEWALEERKSGVRPCEPRHEQPDGSFTVPHGWECIEKEKFVRLELLPPENSPIHSPVSLIWNAEEGWGPVFYRTRYIDGWTSEALAVIHVIGVERTQNGKREQILHRIFPDGSVEVVTEAESCDMLQEQIKGKED